jgi:hypothetical protein
MKDSQDFNHVTVDAINESIVVIEEFPDRLVFASGTTRPSLGKFVSFSTARIIRSTKLPA